MVPASVEEEVFREYGMSAARPQNFEVDFLDYAELAFNDIELYGPNGSGARLYAHVKDQLELSCATWSAMGRSTWPPRSTTSPPTGFSPIKSIFIPIDLFNPRRIRKNSTARQRASYSLSVLLSLYV